MNLEAMMDKGLGRYIVLGFLDSIVTALALSPLLPMGNYYAKTGSALTIMFINLVTAFMAEYTEERRQLGKMERSLFMRQGTMLRTKLYEEKIFEAIYRSGVFGIVSFGAAIITELTINAVRIGWVPLVPVILLGFFGLLMSKYFGGNEVLWFMLYIAMGIAASGLGELIHVALLA
ncbi:MAG: hypothetical protein RXQ96_04595 [Thermocladium sp.]|jgi:hypothetical protein